MKLRFKFLIIILILVLIMFIIFLSQRTYNDIDNGIHWTVKRIYGNKNNDIISGPAIVPHWNDMPLNQQYYSLNYNNDLYLSKYIQIGTDKIGEKLGTETLTGYDTYTNKNYTKNATIYSIKTISEKYAIALQFEENTDYYMYINNSYNPSTLGKLISDLDLKNNMSLGTIYYTFMHNNKYITLEYPNIKDTYIWEILSDNSNSKSESINYNTNNKLQIDINIPLLGYENSKLSLTEDGYIIIDFLNGSTAFNVGKDETQAFISYVTNNYDGVQIVYYSINWVFVCLIILAIIILIFVFIKFMNKRDTT